MGRKAKTNRVPRTRCEGEWTEAAFWSFLRSSLRKTSRRWPPIVRHVWKKYQRPSQSSNKRLKWEYYCSGCGEWFGAKDLQVEHTEPCGVLNSWETFAEYARKMFVDSDALTLYCDGCHKEKTRLEKEEREKNNG